MDQSTTVKLCECGCGRPAPLAKDTDRSRGYVKGQPVRFVKGHGGNRRPPPGRKPRLFVEVGQRIGRGVVLDAAVRIEGSGQSYRGARLRCDCGNEYVARIGALVGKRDQTGNTLSCGCLQRERQKASAPRGAAKRRGRVPHNFIDRTGERFGKLIVVSLAGRREGIVYWLCRCDCGNEKIIASASLKAGLSASCGCARRKPKPGRAKTPGVTARGIVFRQYQKNATARGLTWELTGEDFDRLTSQECFYCGQPPSTVKRSGAWDTGFIYNGIDRADNTLGYAPSNVLPCCRTCNYAKRDMLHSEFMAWLRRVTAHQWFHPEQINPPASLKEVPSPRRKRVNGPGMAK